MSVRLVALVIGAVLLTACSPPAIARPREGAPVGDIAGTTRAAVEPVAPPTLAPAAPAALGATPAPSAPRSVEPSPTPTHVIASTGGTAVNMRTGPSTTAAVVTTLREG